MEEKKEERRRKGGKGIVPSELEYFLRCFELVYDHLVGRETLMPYASHREFLDKSFD